MAAPMAAAKVARAVPPIPPVVTWGLVSVGAWLVYTAVRGLSPLAELTAALQGGPRPPKVGPAVSPSATAGPTIGQVGGPALVGSGTVQPALVSIGQGSHRLAPEAAAAFTTWQSIFGGPITLTDSYRSTQQQADAYAKAVAAGELDRFAPPGRSWHEKGLAVDVNLQAIGASPTGNATQRATFQRLYTASVAAGWCNPRGPGRGDSAEPWHFSYGGCG